MLASESLFDVDFNIGWTCERQMEGPQHPTAITQLQRTAEAPPR